MKPGWTLNFVVTEAEGAERLCRTRCGNIPSGPISVTGNPARAQQEAQGDREAGGRRWAPRGLGTGGPQASRPEKTTAPEQRAPPPGTQERATPAPLQPSKATFAPNPLPTPPRSWEAGLRSDLHPAVLAGGGPSITCGENRMDDGGFLICNRGLGEVAPVSQVLEQRAVPFMSMPGENTLQERKGNKVTRVRRDVKVSCFWQPEAAGRSQHKGNESGRRAAPSKRRGCGNWRK